MHGFKRFNFGHILFPFIRRKQTRLGWTNSHPWVGKAFFYGGLQKIIAELGKTGNAFLKNFMGSRTAAAGPARCLATMVGGLGCRQGRPAGR
jgi:hypothetical protein